ncbi:MAG TPA: DUF2059 domain-containing protein [Xanthobacteraceae bacterium]|jgi:hypothetical protein|nr:DUF2059 domain-containing protein [Xanthobacteraceae bacterium]
MHLKLISSARIAAMAMVMFAGAAAAQTPAPSTIALAKELIDLKGSSNMYAPIIDGVIEQAKGVFLQTNPALAKDLEDVAKQLHTEYSVRRAEIADEVARLYATRFTEQELKEELVFFRTPLGKKIITEEPKIIDESFGRIQQWANKFSEEVVTRVRTDMKKKGHNL